jgi:hypothetical protein
MQIQTWIALFTLLRIWNQLFTLIRIQMQILIQLPRVMRIHADPDPQHCLF